MNVIGVDANETCCVERQKTLAEMSNEIGEMLEQAMGIMSDINVSLFSDSPIEEKRPVSNCLLMDMKLNTEGMQSLLSRLKELKDRLY